MEIAVSISKKISNQEYGGVPYEMTEHFASAKMELDENVDHKSGYKELRQIVLDEVNRGVIKSILELGGGIPRNEFNAVLDKYIAGKPMLEEEYNMMGSFQKAVIQEVKKSKKRNK